MPSVLIVDDDEGVLRSYSAVLSQNGLRVLTAMDGRGGIEEAESHLPNLILLDMLLPDMHGIDVVTALRESARTASIPIIAISGILDRDIRDKVIAAGCLDYFAKPYSAWALLAEVKHHLRGVM